VGMHSITAAYGGDVNFRAATSSPLTQLVDQAPQTITFAASTLSYATGVTLGVAPLSLSATSTSGLSVTLSVLSGPATLSGNTLTITGVGTVIVAANQAGNADYSAASQITENFPVNRALPADALASSLNPALAKNGITLTATITSGAGTPTGTVTFLDGTTALGTGTLTGGAATISISSLTVGMHSITAAYGGDVNFRATTSSPLTQLVEDFSFNNSAPPVTAVPGGSAVFTFTVIPVNATTFPTNIMLTASGLPEGATYTFAPASLTGGEGATPITLTVGIPQTQAASAHSNLQPGTDSRHGRGDGTNRLLPFALTLILLPFAGRLRLDAGRLGRMISLLMFLVAGMCATAALSSCGSSDRSFAPQQQSYTVTITGTAGALSHSVTVTLTVQ